MQTIYLYHQNEQTFPPFPEMVLALGYFDGVHTGHREVIQTAKRKAQQKGCALGIMTFHPHPKAVLSPHASEETMRYITPLRHKEEQLKKEGPDYLFVIHFDTFFASQEPQDFVDNYIIKLNTVHVVAGFDFSYGRLGKGTMETMPFHSRNQLEQTVVGEVKRNGEKVSSTLIREYIEAGNVKEAAAFLGRTYSIRGTVEKGEQRGRTIGFPTANIRKNEAYITPAAGVYAVRIQVEDKWLDGVCNIGYKPTFHEEAPEEPIIEVHIFHFDRNIYGSDTEVAFYSYIRGEEKFNGAAELVEEMNRDAKKAKEILQARIDVP
ncbi:riboflavin biosynthesis protein RibF [Salibacterium aidingense]|uniref:riboflavin biosynthesis protein RibF n=1 Tax=Salibacterium aidingense TaxID=384933 RepID=UPI000415BA3B|nr:riboflavin biosynthesis protein RibF [Salibacterium aidingense]